MLYPPLSSELAIRGVAIADAIEPSIPPNYRVAMERINTRPNRVG